MIITHRAAAHRDEFMAICFWMAVYGLQSISRRDPTPEELDDPSITVIDVGGQHIPANRNFDHHQYRGGDSALVLVLKHLELYYAAQVVFPWIQFSSDLDTLGPFAVAKGLGLTPDQLFSTLSPIEVQILFLFQQEDEVSIKTRILMKAIGDGLLEKIIFYQERMADLAINARIINVGELVGIYSTITDRPSAFLEEFRQQHCPDAAFSICPDDRGDGHTLYRFAEHPALNFSLIEEYDEVIFAHKGGFIAKTHRILDIEGLQVLVALATIRKEVPKKRNLFAEAFAADLAEAME